MADDYDVGYGKPPRANQFRKGQPGNPSGRPKGTVSTATLFRRISQQPVAVKEGDTVKQVAKIEVVLTQLMNKAAGGDMKAIREVLLHDRLYGETTEENQDNGPDAEKDEAVMRKLIARMQRLQSSDEGEK